MKIEKINLPEKIFGIETGLLTVFVPLLGVILLVIMSINLVILPRIGDYSQMVGQLDSLKLQREQMVQKRNYLLSIDQNELKKNADFIVNALLPQRNSYMLVGMVGQIADNYGYQIDSFLINPGEVAKKDNKPLVNGVANIPISLTIVGPANRYLDFVKGLEASLPVLSLDSFKIQSGGGSAKMDLTISAYYIDTNTAVEVTKLTLADLTLTKDESDLITRLNQFTVLGNAGSLESGFNTSKTYVKYNRTNPFSP